MYQQDTRLKCKAVSGCDCCGMHVLGAPCWQTFHLIGPTTSAGEHMLSIMKQSPGLHDPTTVAEAAPSISSTPMLCYLCLQHMICMPIKGHTVNEGQQGDAYLENAGFIKGLWCTVGLGSFCSEDVAPGSYCHRRQGRSLVWLEVCKT